MTASISAEPVTEAAASADFTRLRYAQCWEDADILVDALAIRPGDVCVSICSAGDNSLSLLVADPARVIACDLNPAQLAAARLRIAAYRCLEHGELLELIGSRRATPADRAALYRRCRVDLARDEIGRASRRYWDAQGAAIGRGIGSLGKFERYFRLFRRVALTFIHPRSRVQRLLRGGDAASRRAFYSRSWDSSRWRLMFELFFSRRLMGALGRDPAFFAYVEGSVASRIRARVEHALVALDPADNPYLGWILTGRHGDALPHALRAQHFAPIRDRVDRIELRAVSLEQLLAGAPAGAFQRFNLSDIFEYMSPETSERLLSDVARTTASGGRIAFWNMLAPRGRPPSLAAQLDDLSELAAALHARDKAFFYSRFAVLERTAMAMGEPAR